MLKDGEVPSSHYACARFYIPPGYKNVTVNIGVRKHGRYNSSLRNWPLVDGHFFKEASTVYCHTGFSVTNADGIRFWDAWQRLGLVNVGFPISHRLLWTGAVTQAFQKVIMQWQPGKDVTFVNVFDELHEAGKDHALRVRWAVPKPLSHPFDSYLPAGKWAEVGDEILARSFGRRY